jgi:tRNA(Ile)-lysidine synthase
MQPVSRRIVDGLELEIARPLLGCWREEIDAFVAAERIEFREDASNASPRHARNRLRHEILPALAAAVGRPVRGNLWKAAAILSAENEYFARLPELQNPPAELDARAARALPLALQRRLIHAWLTSHGIEALGFEEVESVRLLLVSESPAKVNLPGDRHARRRAGRLFIERAPTAPE